MGKSVTYALTRALAAYFKTAVPTLLEVYDDFPAPNQALKYPCGSIFTGAPQLLNGLPYVVGKVAPVSPETRWTVRRCVGIWEFKLQVDLWLDNKFMRHDMQEQIVKAFAGGSVPGVNLQLADYFGEWAHFSLVGHSFPDNEQESQRSEWRLKLDVLADVKCLVESLDYLVVEVDNQLTTPGDIPPPDEPAVEITI